jgi:hypothetical protein
MTRTIRLAAAISVMTVMPALASAQINFAKDGYYVAMGDSVAAGEGAMPVTNGYAYELYEQSTFGAKQQTDFANLAVRGGRSWELRDHQVAQVLCAEPAQRPTVVTITAGANDFLRGDVNVPAIAARVVESIHLLLNNDSALTGAPALDPVTGMPCRALANVTILVSNYYHIPHPVPQVSAQLEAALQGFDQALRFWLQFVNVPQGSRVALVDLYSASEGQQGLVTVERRLGYDGPADFDVHPTNLGHSFIAREFETVWNSLP